LQAEANKNSKKIFHNTTTCYSTNNQSAT
jgi:hypothetical protein